MTSKPFVTLSGRNLHQVVIFNLVTLRVAISITDNRVLVLYLFPPILIHVNLYSPFFCIVFFFFLTVTCMHFCLQRMSLVNIKWIWISIKYKKTTFYMPVYAQILPLYASMPHIVETHAEDLWCTPREMQPGMAGLPPYTRVERENMEQKFLSQGWFTLVMEVLGA